MANSGSLTKADENPNCGNLPQGWVCGYRMGEVWHWDLSNPYLLDIINCCKVSSPSNACHIAYEEEPCARLRANAYPIPTT